jgi:hypothetical protein
MGRSPLAAHPPAQDGLQADPVLIHRPGLDGSFRILFLLSPAAASFCFWPAGNRGEYRWEVAGLFLCVLLRACPNYQVIEFRLDFVQAG